MLTAIVFGTLGVAAVVFGLYLRAHPVLPQPRFKFNALLPRLFGTGAMCFFGWCWVARSYINPHHRAHEYYHHLRVLALGRWRHGVQFLWDFLKGLTKYGLAKVDTGTGRRELKAYWFHPEEIAARDYADQNYTQFLRLG